MLTLRSSQALTSDLFIFVWIKLRTRGARRGKLKTRSPHSRAGWRLNRYAVFVLSDVKQISLGRQVRLMSIHTDLTGVEIKNKKKAVTFFIGRFHLFFFLCSSLSVSTEKSDGPCSQGEESWCTLLWNTQCEKQEQEQKGPSTRHRRQKGQTIKALDWSHKTQRHM